MSDILTRLEDGTYILSDELAGNFIPTPNLGLLKEEPSNYYNLAVTRKNLEIIDNAVGTSNVEISNIKNFIGLSNTTDGNGQVTIIDRIDSITNTIGNLSNMGDRIITIADRFNGISNTIGDWTNSCNGKFITIANRFNDIENINNTQSNDIANIGEYVGYITNSGNDTHNSLTNQISTIYNTVWDIVEGLVGPNMIINEIDDVVPGGQHNHNLNGLPTTGPSWYAPTKSGKMGQYLISNGTNQEPIWENAATSISTADSKLTPSNVIASYLNEHYIDNKGGIFTGAIYINNKNDDQKLATQGWVNGRIATIDISGSGESDHATTATYATYLGENELKRLSYADVNDAITVENMPDKLNGLTSTPISPLFMDSNNRLKPYRLNSLSISYNSAKDEYYINPSDTNKLINLGNDRNMYNYMYTNSIISNSMRSNNITAGNITMNVFGGSIKPTYSNKVTLGQDDARWQNVYSVHVNTTNISISNLSGDINKKITLKANIVPDYTGIYTLGDVTTSMDSIYTLHLTSDMVIVDELKGRQTNSNTITVTGHILPNVGTGQFPIERKLGNEKNRWKGIYGESVYIGHDGGSTGVLEVYGNANIASSIVVSCNANITGNTSIDGDVKIGGALTLRSHGSYRVRRARNIIMSNTMMIATTGSTSTTTTAYAYPGDVVHIYEE